MARPNVCARHAWWRGRRVMWRRPSPMATDVARLCRATDLARQCRALIHGAAEPGINAAAASCPSSRRSARNRARQGRRARLRPRLPAAEDAVRRGRVRPCQLARLCQQASQGSKRAAPARPPAARCRHRARTQARLPLRPEPPVMQGGCPPRPAPAPPGPVLRAAAMYSTNIVSTVNKVSKIIKV